MFFSIRNANNNKNLAISGQYGVQQTANTSDAQKWGIDTVPGSGIYIKSLTNANNGIGSTYTTSGIYNCTVGTISGNEANMKLNDHRLKAEGFYYD